MKKKLIFFCVLIAFAVACRNNSEVSSSNLEDTEKDTTIEVSSKEKFYETVSEISSPNEIIHAFDSAHVKFNPTLLHPLKKEFEITTSAQKALHYGAYVVDIIYLSVFNQRQDIIKYHINARKLAQSLNVLNCFETISTVRFEKNVTNKDSLFQIIETLNTSTTAYLISSSRLNTAAQILTGAWLESFYITLKSVNKTEQTEMNAHLVDLLLKQKYNLKGILDLFSELKDKENLTLVYELKRLYSIYTGLGERKTLNKEEVESLLKAVKDIRANVLEV